MGITFSKSRPATSDEAMRFEKLFPIKLFQIAREGRDAYVVYGRGRADFDKDGTLDRFVCADKQSGTAGRDFGCVIKSSGTTLWTVNVKESTPQRQQPIRELRVGDINKDGRLDIAIRLPDGSIRVFENKSNSK